MCQVNSRATVHSGISLDCRWGSMLRGFGTARHIMQGTSPGKLHQQSRRTPVMIGQPLPMDLCYSAACPGV